MAESQDGQQPTAESMELEKSQAGLTRASPEPERGEDRRRARKSQVKEEEVLFMGVSFAIFEYLALAVLVIV